MTAVPPAPQSAPLPDGSTASDAIVVQRALERLRQERETFDQRRNQDATWFRLRMAMGVAAILIIVAVVGISVWLLADPDQSDAVKSLAASALLVDVFGLAAAVWKIVLNPASLTELMPVTETED